MSQYATATDLARFGAPAASLAAFDGTAQTAALVAASAVADGFLAKRFALPLSTWGDDLRKHVSWIAAYDLLSARGFREDALGADTLEARHDKAMAWLRGIAAGSVEPQGITDASPTTRETAGVVVVSRTRRGW